VQDDVLGREAVVLGQPGIKQLERIGEFLAVRGIARQATEDEGPADSGGGRQIRLFGHRRAAGIQNEKADEDA
jgi:hypothetical protein